MSCIGKNDLWFQKWQEICWIFTQVVEGNIRWVILKYATTHNYPQIPATSHNHPQPPTTIHNQPQLPTTIFNHPQSHTTIHNHQQLSATTHNHPQPFTTTCKYPQPPTIIQNYQQPPTTIHNYLQLPITIHNYPQPPKKPSTTTQKLPKKAKTCHKQLCYCILDVNTEADVGFDSDMKQWHVHVRVCLCVYALEVIMFTIFRLADCLLLPALQVIHLMLIVTTFVSKENEFMNWSVQQWKLPYESLRKLSIFTGKYYCLCRAAAAIDINVKTLMEFSCHNLFRIL